jgi:serine protease Do
MRGMKHLLIVLLIVGVISVGLACALAGNTNKSTSAASTPINASWSPVYVDEASGTTLSKADLVTELATAVVSITTQGVGYNMFYQPVPESGAASGVIIDPEGYIVTNNHVVSGASTLTVTLSDGRSFVAVKWAGDESTDLAVVQIQTDDALLYAHFLSNSLDNLSLLEDVVAVGNALALPGGPTWTEGVVSYLGRSIEESNNVVLDDLIQTDAAINAGNSGGPLVNMAGQVVGINTAIASGAENIGFAISTDTAIDTVHSLVTKGSESSPWLGVNTLTVTKSVKTQYGLSVDSGALVASVVSGGPAATAGLITYDVITNIDDTDIGTSQELGTAIQSHSAGDKVTITYRRGQTTMTTEATLGQKPSG